MATSHDELETVLPEDAFVGFLRQLMLQSPMLDFDDQQDISEIRTYAEAGLALVYRGLVVTLEDGSEFRVQVQRTRAGGRS